MQLGISGAADNEVIEEEKGGLGIGKIIITRLSNLLKPDDIK